MVGLELYVKDEENVFQRIELFKDESVTITQSLQDVKDIAKVFSDYSQTFNVPASKKNNRVFEHFYNYHINIFDARRKKDAKLYLNHQLFKEGKIKLEGTTLKNNKAHTYKLTFFGSGVNLKDIYDFNNYCKELSLDVIGTMRMLFDSLVLKYSLFSIPSDPLERTPISSSNFSE